MKHVQTIDNLRAFVHVPNAEGQSSGHSAFEKGLRERLMLKSAERRMIEKRSQMLMEFRKTQRLPPAHRAVLRSRCHRMVKENNALQATIRDAHRKLTQEEKDAEEIERIRRESVEHLLALRGSGKRKVAYVV